MRFSSLATWAFVVIGSRISTKGVYGFVMPLNSVRTIDSRRRFGTVSVGLSGDGNEGDVSAVAVEEKTEEAVVETEIEEKKEVEIGYRIEKEENIGLNKSTIHRCIIQLGDGEDIVLESGKIGRQASGAITLTRGTTVLLATASRDRSPKENLDFIPLSVEHQERFSSAGMTSGAYNKRDGRPSDHNILTCRLIDRPLRPLIHSGWRHETQLLSWVLSYDGRRSCDPLAIMGSSAALWISDIPLTKPVGAVEVGYDETTDTFILNPSHEQFEATNHKLHLTVAGTYDGVLMIEGAADFLPEDVMIRAVQFGHEAIKTICAALQEFGEAIGREKYTETLQPPTPPELHETLEKVMRGEIEKVLTMNHVEDGEENPYVKDILSDALMGLYTTAQNYFQEQVGEGEEMEYTSSEIKSAVKKMIGEIMYETSLGTGKRCDGRKLTEVRPIDIETTLLPSVHGSALFTRGETQAVATATLGDSGMKQKIDKLDGMTEKRFYLQYTFPPSSVGETGRVGSPGRREIGHGNLAER